jgi:hypothetical protein
MINVALSDSADSPLATPSMAATHAAKDIVFFCLEKEGIFCTLIK